MWTLWAKAAKFKKWNIANTPHSHHPPNTAHSSFAVNHLMAFKIFTLCFVFILAWHHQIRMTFFGILYEWTQVACILWCWLLLSICFWNSIAAHSCSSSIFIAGKSSTVFTQCNASVSLASCTSTASSLGLMRTVLLWAVLTLHPKESKSSCFRCWWQSQAW